MIRRYLFAIILLAIFSPHSKSQQVFELTCPAGTVSYQPLQTFDLATGKFRQNYCADANGNVTQSVTANTFLSSLNRTTLYVDDKTNGALYPTCQSAVNAAGSSVPTLIIEAGDYSGPDCNLPIPVNIVLHTSNNVTEYTNGINWLYTSSGGTQSYMHVKMQRSAIPAGGATVAGYFTNTLNAYTQVAGIGADGGSFEMNTTGPFSGTLPVIQGAENNITVGSTGGTITNATGLVAYYNSQAGSTTAIGTVIGVRGLGANSVLGAAPVNAYGVYAEDQTAASVRNFALAAKGYTLLVYSGNKGAAGIQTEDASNVAHQFIYMDSGNQEHIQAPNVNGTSFDDSGGSPRAKITGSGLFIQNTSQLGLGTVAFASLPASNNGTTIFCSDCNPTCTAGASTGRTCFRENGAWTH